jgi:hypothetical protein
VDNALAYRPLEGDMLLNVAQCRDALDLLRALPAGCAPLAFFDPQHRGVLDRLKFGNEGARQRGRAKLPAICPRPTSTRAAAKSRGRSRLAVISCCGSTHLAYARVIIFESPLHPNGRHAVCGDGAAVIVDRQRDRGGMASQKGAWEAQAEGGKGLRDGNGLQQASQARLWRDRRSLRLEAGGFEELLADGADLKPLFV